MSVKKEEETYIKPEGIIIHYPKQFCDFHASYIDEDDYQPSAELLAALNTLPPELLDVKMEADEEELKPQVKPEPIEHEIGGT